MDYGGTLVEELEFDTQRGAAWLLARAAFCPPHVTLDDVIARADRVTRDLAMRRDELQIETPWAHERRSRSGQLRGDRGGMSGAAASLRRSSMRGFFVLVWTGIAAAACTSSSDPGAALASNLAGAPGGRTAHGGMPCPCDHDDYACSRATRGFEISPVPIDTRGKSSDRIVQVGYGSYLVNAASDCAGCHSTPAGFLAGGNPFALDRNGHVVFARNLTPDPMTGMHLTEDQFVEALRTGRDFHPRSAGMMVVMPWLFFRWASDGDLRAIYASGE